MVGGDFSLSTSRKIRKRGEVGVWLVCLFVSKRLELLEVRLLIYRLLLRL